MAAENIAKKQRLSGQPPLLPLKSANPFNPYYYSSFFSPYTFKNREKKWRQEDKWLKYNDFKPPLFVSPF